MRKGYIFLLVALLLALMPQVSSAMNQPTPVQYETPLAGTPLDYAQRDNWLVFTGHDKVKYDVDVFFLYPTSAALNCQTDICEDLSLMTHNATRSYLQSAETMAEYANIYVPYYRQVSGKYLATTQGLNAEVLEEYIKTHVTRTDVYAALDYYFTYCNQGRPYILAGHSQGSINLKLVLSEYMRLHPEHYQRMIACYAIGYYFPQSWFAQNPHVKPAKGERDTGVLITWNTEGPGCTAPNLVLGKNDGFCINPLNWRTDEKYVAIALNKGSCKVDGVTLIKEQVHGLADAQIDKKRGALITRNYTAYMPPNPLFGEKSCHFEDWSLFTQNIKENGLKRIEAYWAGHASASMKPPF